MFKVEPRLNYEAKKEYDDLFRLKEKNANNKDALIEM